MERHRPAPNFGNGIGALWLRQNYAARRAGLVVRQDPTVLAPVFHELATNAAKYGALSVPGGHLTISWRPSGDIILIEWVEPAARQ